MKARFTRSFLAQLIGLRVNYKVSSLQLFLEELSIFVRFQYFESDDPVLYSTKIQHILENDVTDLELSFTEEEFDASQGSLTVSKSIHQTQNFPLSR